MEQGKVKGMPRPLPLILFGLLPATLLAPLVVGGCAPRRPHNVLVVTIDTLRADRIGPYGYGLARTPALDRLAQEGTTVEDASTAAPITLVAHSTMFTGLLPLAHGVRDNGAYALGEGAVTLAERLQARGFETRAFVSALVLNRRYGLAQGFDSYDDDLWSEDQPKLFLIRDRPAPRTAERFLRWYEGRAERERPFFAWVHFFDPHQPYEPPAKDRLFAANPYDAEITVADRGLGMVLDALRARGDLDRTLVVVTADHGESLGEHNEKTHAVFVYDATIKVPLLLRLPGLIPAGARWSGPAHHVDLPATVLAALGLPGGETTEGIDWLPWLRRGQSPPDRALYHESLLSEIGFGMAPLQAVRSGGFKWIRAPRPELYDLRADPHELTNLAEREPRQGRALDRRLDELVRASEALQVAAAPQTMDQETLETLQALGYLAPAGSRDSFSGMDPKDGISLYNDLEDARHLAQEDRWDDAAARLQAVLAVLPRNQSALNLLGLAEIRRGRWAEAKDAYYRSLALEPRQSRVYMMLGAIAIQEADLTTAERRFREALEQGPGFVEAMAQLGLIEAYRGREAAAEEWYQRALAADPSFPRVWRLLGDLEYERGAYQVALGHYEKALEVVPGDLHALIQAGNAARRLDRPAEAARFFERASALRPDSWLPLYNLACLFAVTGRTAEALPLLDRAVEAGFRSLRLAQSDNDLDALRPLPAFAVWLKRVRLARVEEEAGDDLPRGAVGAEESP